MLRPNEDRQDYGAILSPPLDYKLEFAVGTTYSLDFDALVGACLALGLGAETDSALMRDPVCLLDALRRTSDKLALFCQGGQIHMPGSPTPLYILLEQMVFPVRMPQRRGTAAYPSFHPKLWLICYQNAAQERLYRLVVLSRNLTFDRSWDVVWYMDGRVKGTHTDKNQPLCSFLRSLLRHVPRGEKGREKRRGIRALIRDLPEVVFETGDKAFYDYDFYPFGVVNEQGQIDLWKEVPLFSQSFHELLIISPFLSGSVIHDFNQRSILSRINDVRCTLITRAQSLAALKPEDISGFQLFTLRDAVIDGEESISESGTAAKRQDIHAKLYLIRKYSQTDLYLGSLNASHNALNGNVEFLIRLRSQNRYLNLDKLAAELFGKNEGENPFQEAILPKSTDEQEADNHTLLEGIIREIDRSGPTASVEEETEGRYSLSVHFAPCDTRKIKVALCPLLSMVTRQFAEKVVFESLRTLELSEFYVLSASDGEETVRRVLKIPTTGLPEQREERLMAEVVRSQGFYRYIAYLLGDNALLSALEGSSEGIMGTCSSTVQHGTAGLGLYEKMLQTAAEAPERFREVESLMSAVSGENVVPEAFRSLYDTFKMVVSTDG